MRNANPFSNRQADQQRAREKLAERLNKRSQKRATNDTAERPDSPAQQPSPSVRAEPERPWAHVRLGSANFRYYASAPPHAEIYLQPWARDLVNVVLEACDSGGTHLCLIWPATLEHPALLHALANLQRNSASDLRGLRTWLFPGSHATRLALQTARVDREALAALDRAGWSTRAGETSFHAATRSVSFEAILTALNNTEIWNNQTADPPLGALIPCFVYAADSTGWTASSRNQLEVALTQVHRRVNRNDARQKIALEWGVPVKAPGALMVMHNTATKKTWAQALASKVLLADGPPDWLLLDATMAASNSNSDAVHRIPEFLHACRKARASIGAVVVTDDPKTFLVMRARLLALRLDLHEHVWAAEAEHAVLAPDPKPDGWSPEQRSNSNCRVSIVDREAAVVASKFYALANEVGGDEHPGHHLLAEACLFVLRLSNLPAGITDLIAELAERAADEFSASQYSWARVATSLQSAIESGVLSAKRPQVERALERAGKLVAAWKESTPMAEKLLADVQAHVVGGKKSLVVVLPNRSYITLARRFLHRRLGDVWATIEHRVDWHTLSSFSYLLQTEKKGHHYTVVGLNHRVLRLLLTHPGLPHGTNVLLSYKQADAALKTLKGMKEIAAFKPYRGRIGLLAQELDLRLRELPPQPIHGKVGEFTMSFDLNDVRPVTTGGEQSYYRFDLDGGAHMYASGWVYRYDIEEGPSFRRVPAHAIAAGDFVFDMNDVLRTKIEETLQLSSSGSSITAYPERTLLKLYHDDVQARCALFFPDANNRAALARAIWNKMVAGNEQARDCGPERIQYWLNLGDQHDQRPHAPKDAKHFLMFCDALDIRHEQAEQHWNFIRNARRLNQNLGRELSARYAEILFQPESAITYRKVPPAVIGALQQEAVLSVHQVTRVTPPTDQKSR